MREGDRSETGSEKSGIPAAKREGFKRRGIPQGRMLGHDSKDGRIQTTKQVIRDPNKSRNGGASGMEMSKESMREYISRKEFRK